MFEYWAPYLASKGLPNTYWAELCCPGCGRVGLLGSNHVVLDTGEVKPSDVCGFDAKWAKRHGETACTYHEHIHLDDWDRPSTPRRER